MTDQALQGGNIEPPRPNFKWNALFRGDHAKASYNACVGDNGAPDIYYYADGFAESVRLLIEGLTQGRGMLDTLIYPICFCMRHAVELAIKAQIEGLANLATVRNAPLGTKEEIDKKLTQHDIQNLWDYFVLIAKATDRRYGASIDPLVSLIQCIGDTDPTGQTFRYAYSNENKKHLTDVSLINVLVLQDQFMHLWDGLESLRLLTEAKTREYNTGTFTRRLSREDLMSIAARLPARERWGRSEFAEVKATIKIEYAIGSKELCSALTLIQQTRDMARMIGLSVTIPGLSVDDFVQLNDIWKITWDFSLLESELHAYIYGQERSAPEPQSLMEKIQRQHRAVKAPQQGYEQFYQWVTPEKLAGLLTLMNSGTYIYCEEYDQAYLKNQKLMTAVFSGTQEAREAEIREIWSESVESSSYPVRIFTKLNGAGFPQEASVVAETLFA